MLGQIVADRAATDARRRFDALFTDDPDRRPVTRGDLDAAVEQIAGAG